MARPYNITITDGVGSAQVLDGNYSVTANVDGYNNSSISPNSLEIVQGTNNYELKISADGTLTLHVSETGEASGKAVVGAKFIRCDSNGTTYGNEIQSDESGNAVFNNVPYGTTGAVKIYYKQTSSDGEHQFDNTLKEIILEASTETVEVINQQPPLRTFTLTDSNYSGLLIKSGSISLN